MRRRSLSFSVVLLMMLFANGQCQHLQAQSYPLSSPALDGFGRNYLDLNADEAMNGPMLQREAGQAASAVQSEALPTAKEIQNQTMPAAQSTEPSPTANIDTNRIPTKVESFWRNVEINGHIRVRQETDWERIEQPTRNRGRLRARLAFTWNPNEEFKAGFRWTTGDRKLVLEPGDRRGAPLSYQDLGDVFDKFELNLDRIFITYQPKWLSRSFVTVGKFRFPGKLNPIFSDPIGDLVFDEAIQPEGITAGYTWKPNRVFDEVYWTAGETVYLEQGGADESSMFFTQLWAKRQQSKYLTLEGGVTWFDWHNLNADGSTRISFENNFGNEVISVGPNPRDVIFASEFSVINPMLVVTADDQDPCSGFHPIQLVWETFYNSKAFDRDRDTGYSIGFQYGPAVNQQARKRGDWKCYYTWNKIEQESVLTSVAQDDWHRATNFRGQWFGLDYFVRDNIEFRFWFLEDHPILPINSRSEIDFVNGTTQQEWRGRVDLTVYF